MQPACTYFSLEGQKKKKKDVTPAPSCISPMLNQSNLLNYLASLIVLIGSRVKLSLYIGQCTTIRTDV